MRAIELGNDNYKMDEQDSLETIQLLQDNAFFRQWCQANQLDDSQREMLIQNYRFKISQWLDSISCCQNCTGLKGCPFSPQGFRPYIRYNGVFLENSMQYCTYYTQQKQKYQFKSNYVYSSLPESLYDARIEDFMLYRDTVRDGLNFVSTLRNSIKDNQGLFLYGNCGCGKSYIGAAMCNLYARNNKKVAFVNVNQLVNEGKNSFNTKDSNFQEQLDDIKQCYFVCFDDVGANTNSPWVRDELLFPLFNYRMEHELMTMFTSNMELEGLTMHFTYNSNGSMESLKANRIMERITVLAKPLLMNGKDLRK